MLNRSNEECKNTQLDWIGTQEFEHNWIVLLVVFVFGHELSYLILFFIFASYSVLLNILALKMLNMTDQKCKNTEQGRTGEQKCQQQHGMEMQK